MGSPDQYCPNSVEAHLIFKWTGLLMGNKNRARTGPSAGHLMGNVYGPKIKPSSTLAMLSSRSGSRCSGSAPSCSQSLCLLAHALSLSLSLSLSQFSTYSFEITCLSRTPMPPAPAATSEQLRAHRCRNWPTLSPFFSSLMIPSAWYINSL